MTVTLEKASTSSEGAPPPVTRLVVQQRQRLFREGISQLLAAEADIEVAAVAATDADLLEACETHRPSVVVIEADTSEWDPLRLVACMRRAIPGLRVIGLAATPPTGQAVAWARQGGMSDVVAHTSGIGGILRALRTSTSPWARDRQSGSGTSVVTPSPAALTDRELEILSLVAAGLTSTGVANRLQISHKTVENHKQRIFTKLGVQNQAHAVSIAIRTGLMRPDRVIDLASGD